MLAALTAASDTTEFHFRKGGYGAGGYGYTGACYGCYGCYGGCYGAYGGISYGCNGFGCAGSHGCYGCHGNYTCYGCYGCTGWSPATAPMMMGPVGTVVPQQMEKAPMPEKVPEKKAMMQAPAKLIVELPADARLFVDGQLVSSPTTARREFNVPPLEKGQSYFYELKVEAERDGQTVRESRRVILAAGERVTANFKDLGVAAREKTPEVVAAGTGAR
jgi:uncharacterized protein (TIGR03000 family)